MRFFPKKRDAPPLSQDSALPSGASRCSANFTAFVSDMALRIWVTIGRQVRQLLSGPNGGDRLQEKNSGSVSVTANVRAALSVSNDRHNAKRTMQVYVLPNHHGSLHKDPQLTSQSTY